MTTKDGVELDDGILDPWCSVAVLHVNAKFLLFDTIKLVDGDNFLRPFWLAVKKLL